MTRKTTTELIEKSRVMLFKDSENATSPHEWELCMRLKNSDDLIFNLTDAILDYDEAIKECANDPKKMSTYCTAQDESLDDLYEQMVELAEQCMGIQE